MEKFKVTFEANDQQLKSLGTKHASDTYADIEATFVLGSRWTDMDSVSAVWWNDFTRIATVLDSDGKCIVPHEVLTRKGYVRVNLVGSVVENGELVTRLTSYSAEAVKVNEKIKLTGSETSEITPSQYEQFVANVKADADRAEAGATASANSADEAEASAQNASESASASAVSASDSARSATASAGYAQNASESAQSAENAKDDAEDARDEILGMRATAETLEAGSDATASYSDGLLTLGIPRGDQGIQGIQGETGATPNLTIGTVETLEPTEDATASITGTAENPVLNLGLPKGDTGEVSLEDLGALLPTDTASGSVVTITDGQAVVPAKSLKVALEPIQSGSGTPSPDNVRPISGHTEVDTHRTGKNLLDTTAWVEDHYIGANGVSGAEVGVHYTENYSPIKSGTYTIRIPRSASKTVLIRLHGYDANHNWLKQVYTENLNQGTSIYSTQITIDESVKYLRMSITSVATDVQLELGSTTTPYEPYNGQTYTTTLGRTVYGGTLDVVSGELVVDRVSVDMGSLSWAINGAIPSGMQYACTTLSDKAVGETNFICSAYETHTPVQTIGMICGRATTKTVSVNSTITNLNDFIASVTGQTLCYELSTPQTYQLTPQEVQLLLGTNNVWSDGNVTLVYSADIQRWVEKKLQP